MLRGIYISSRCTLKMSSGRRNGWEWTILDEFCGVGVIRRRLSEVRLLSSLFLLSSRSLWYFLSPPILHQSDMPSLCDCLVSECIRFIFGDHITFYQALNYSCIPSPTRAHHSCARRPFRASCPALLRSRRIRRPYRAAFSRQIGRCTISNAIQR